MKDKYLFMAGVLCLFVVLLLMPSVMDESSNSSWIKKIEKRCQDSCAEINMTMLMISDELQCMCKAETPGVRRYPWK
jgi:hypothetical protein